MRLKGIDLLRFMKNFLDMVSLLGMAALFVFFAVIFINFPADRSYYIMVLDRAFTVEKITLFAVFIVGCGINGFLFILSRFPKLYKYPVKITADNIEIQYHLSKIMLSALQICTIFLFGFIILLMYLSAAQDAKYTFVPYIVSMCIVALCIYLFYLAAARKHR